MQTMSRKYLVWMGAISGVLVLAPVWAGDWPQWGRNQSRNMVSSEGPITSEFAPGSLRGRQEQIDPDTTRNIKWVVKLGSQTYGNPTVGGGRVLIGTNNESPLDPKYKGDRANLYCLDEQTGDLVWQLSLPKLGSGKVGDWEFLGICSSASVIGNRVYVVTNLCEVICLDLLGMSNGNDGPFTDEAKYYVGSTISRSISGGVAKDPVQLGDTDADVIWRFDMRNELGVFPHNITSSSPLVVDGAVYASTSNGVDWSHVDVPNKKAPCLIKLDAETGQLLGEEASGIGERILHCNWSSPAFGRVGAQAMILFAAGDGFMYSFNPRPVTLPDEFGDDYPVLEEWWRSDGVPAEYRFSGGKPIRYATAKGPSEFIATPVFYKDRVYAAIGQDPEHGEGVGSFNCFDATISNEKMAGADRILWQYKQINRSISTCSIVDDLVYIADYAGIIHCLDANTGEAYWTYDTFGHIWGSTLVVGDRVYVGNEDGILTVLAAGKQKKLLAEIEFPGAIYSSPIVANGVLYVATQKHLFAITDTP